MGKAGSFLLVVLLLALLGGVFVFWQMSQGRSIRLLDQVRQATLPDPEDLGKFGVEVPDVGSSGLQFYGRMRYRDKHITYWIEDSCSLDKQRDILEVFRILESETVLEFDADKQGAEIRVLCAELPEEKGRQKHVLAGEGGPSAIINTSRYAVIFEGKVSLYREEECDRPQVALHELLHALGFDHSDDKSSVLYPITSCSQELKGVVLAEIGNLYVEDSLPDIVLDSVGVVKQGVYVHFNVTVSNQGLADVAEAVLVLEADGKEVQEFPLGDVPIGGSRILSAQWVQVSKKSEGLRFSVRGVGGPSGDGVVKELDMGNNAVQVVGGSSANL